MCNIDHETFPRPCIILVQTMCNIGRLSWWGECACTSVDHASYWSMMLAWSPSHSMSSRWLGLTLLKGLATPYRMSKPKLVGIYTNCGASDMEVRLRRGDDINQDTISWRPFLQMKMEVSRRKVWPLNDEEDPLKVLEGPKSHKEEKSHVGSRRKHLERYK